MTTSVGSAARKSASDGTVAGPIRTVPVVTAEPFHWIELTATLLGILLVGAGVAMVNGVLVSELPALMALFGLVCALAGFVGARADRRRSTLASASNVMGQTLKTAVRIDAARWRGLWVGVPYRVRIRYTELAAGAFGTMLALQLTSAAHKALGTRFVIRRHNPRRGLIVLVAEEAAKGPDPSEVDLQQRRIEEVALETFGTDVTVNDVTIDDSDTVNGFTLSYRSGAVRLTIPTVRRRVVNAVTDRLPGKWKADFALQDDQVTFTRRPPLPTFAARPTTPVPDIDDPAFNLIPQAVDEDGNMLHWDIGGVMAHVLKAGRTRTGKSVSLIGDAIEASRRNFRIFVLDPKRTEFLGLRDWPNVQYVATREHDQAALTHLIYLEMLERYRQVEEEGASETSFDRILLVIDEYRQLFALIKPWWTRIKVTGMPSECPMFDEIGSLLRMAAACRIHVVLATQRPDAEFLKGEALAIDTPIPTPSGWATMGTLTVGDQVFDEHGRPITVTAVTDTLRNRPCFRVTFSDGATITADENHLWIALVDHQPTHPPSPTRRTRRPSPAPIRRHPSPAHGSQVARQRDTITDRAPAPPIAHRATSMPPPTAGLEARPPAPLNGNGASRLLTTGQLASSLQSPTPPRWAVAAAGPLTTREVELPMQPFAFGRWLRATKLNPADSHPPPEDAGKPTPSPSSAFALRLPGAAPATQPDHPSVTLLDELRRGDGRIPTLYLRASHRQRSQLLDGLVGTATAHPTIRNAVPLALCALVGVEEGFMTSLHELVVSLGLIATLNASPAGMTNEDTAVHAERAGSVQRSWKVTFRIPPDPLHVTTSPDHRPGDPTRVRYVTAVEPIESVPVRCITVDSPTHLYLAGRSMIPTHNCRDNFSARAATGRLTPDGAEMMFESPHIGVTIPLNVRGRGTMISTDDRPHEVQFLYTPDPRKATDPDDLALLAALRPRTTRWPRLAIDIPELAQVAADIPSGAKVSLEWEQLMRARFVPYIAPPNEPHRAVPADERCTRDETDSAEDVDDGYGPARVTRADRVEIGDLVQLEDDRWMCVEDRIIGDDGQIQIDWRDDDDRRGEHVMPVEELIDVRSPNPTD